MVWAIEVTVCRKQSLVIKTTEKDNFLHLERNAEQKKVILNVIEMGM